MSHDFDRETFGEISSPVFAELIGAAPSPGFIVPITSTMHMNMTMNGSNYSSSELVMMTPYLHFTGGDYLFFKFWHPSSRGAIAGASIALLILAISDRCLNAVRGVMDARWRKSALALETRLDGNAQVDDPSSTKRFRNTRRIRTIPSFVLSRDAARGALYSLQALLSYALMLAVMTFQAAYIIAIIFGLGLGEILFGRLATAQL